MSTEFNLTKESWKLFGIQLGIGVAVAVMLTLIEHFVKHSFGSGLSFLSVVLGGLFYAQRYEKKHPGVLEPHRKKLAFRAMINTAIVEVPFLILVTLAMCVDEQTGNFKLNPVLLLIMIGIGVGVGLPLTYFLTRFALKQGIKTMVKANAQKSPPQI